LAITHEYFFEFVVISEIRVKQLFPPCHAVSAPSPNSLASYNPILLASEQI
jgi:hypothetical protein